MSTKPYSTMPKDLPEERVFDVRLRRRRLSRGDLDESGVKKWLKALSDLDGEFDVVDIDPPGVVSEDGEADAAEADAGDDA